MTDTDTDAQIDAGLADRAYYMVANMRACMDARKPVGNSVTLSANNKVGITRCAWEWGAEDFGNPSVFTADSAYENGDTSVLEIDRYGFNGTGLRTTYQVIYKVPDQNGDLITYKYIKDHAQDAPSVLIRTIHDADKTVPLDQAPKPVRAVLKAGWRMIDYLPPPASQ